MDNGFGINLEGFLIHGNLSLNPGIIPIENGDGSIEASGTFYIDTLREYNTDHGIDIQQVIFHSDYIEIPFNKPSQSTQGALTLNGGITIKNTTNSTSLTSGGTITTYGGVSIMKTLNVGGEINSNNNKIINVAWPTEPLDAANKAYVDSKTSGNIAGNFSGGQVLIGGLSGDVLGFPAFVYNTTTNQLIISNNEFSDITHGAFILDGGITIKNTTDSTSISSGGAITTYGGVSIGKTLNVGGEINSNNNKIINVAWPTDPLDVANKAYVDSKTSGSIVGNFSGGQVLIGGLSGDVLGFPTFVYNTTTNQLIISNNEFSDITHGALILDGGITIKNTTNSTSLTSGGGMTLYGGVSIGKTLNVGGGINNNNNKIINVTWPTDPLDAANKAYVDSKTSGNVIGNFSAGQVLVGGLSGNALGFSTLIYNSTTCQLFILDNQASDITHGALILNGGITIKNTTDSTSLTSGGGMTLYGGVSIRKTLNVGGGINNNNNKIINVAWPTNPLDAANKAYVDSKTTGNLSGNFSSGQVLIGGSNGNVLGFSTLIYNSTTGQFSILDTQDALNATTGSLVSYGGITIQKSLYVGGPVDVNNNFIHNVLTPVLPNDAVNKRYVDNLAFGTSSSFLTNYTSGQIIIGGSDGNLIGYNSYIINASSGLLIYDTTDATGLGTGGNLTLYGGASINKHVFIGEGLDVNLTNITNVATPINGYDAVNKDYIDAKLNNLPSNNYCPQIYSSEHTFILDNNVLIPQNIPYLTLTSDVTVSFITYIYVNSPTYTSFYTIYSYFNGSVWTYSTRFSGHSLNIDFVVQTSNTKAANVCYINRNLTGVTSIKYYVYEDIQVNPNTSQLNYVLESNKTDFLNYLYTDIHTVQLHVHVWVDTKSAYFIINLLLKNNEWIMNCDRIGPDIGISFTMNNKNNLGNLQYINTNNKDAIARVKQYKILQSYSTFRLLNSTYNGLTPIDINTMYGLIYIYVEKPEIHQYAFYTVEYLIFNDNWYTNSSFIGDYLHVSFSINHDGILTYINNDPINLTNIKVLVNPQDGCLCNIGDGGMGGMYFEPDSILIGNGYGPIISTTDFTYKDCVLEMKCEDAQIIIYNTTDATGLGTGGNLTLHGGASIEKHVFIGGGLDVNLKNITNVATPINGYDAVNKDYLDALLHNIPLNNYVTQPYNYQQFFILNNNVLSPTQIPYLTISADVTVSFIAYIYVNSPTFKSLYTIYSYFNGSVWTYFSRFSGPPLDVDFIVTTTNNKLANVCYINRKLTGTTSIEYYIYEDIQIKPNTSQFNYILTKSIIPYDFLNYLYTHFHSIKLHIHVWVNGTTAAYFLIDLLLKDNEWVLNCDRIGPDIGVYFTMNNKNSIGSLQCVNLNNGIVVARVKEYKILQSYSTFRLLNSTYNGLVTPIDIKTDYCQLYIYVEKPEIHQYAFYTIEGFLFNNEWYTNSSFIGDYLHVSFSINNTGILTYINNDPTYITNIKILVVEPDIFVPLQVQDGGTGNSYLEPYSVLIGNGTGPIINTSEFIYQECILHMKCPDAQIIIYNTTDATGLGTGGNLTLYGGASIDKTLYVGSGLYVNNINITPSIGDLNEHVFYANNNVAIPEIIPGFIFDTTLIKSFISHIAITVMLLNEQYDVLVILKGINTSKGWVLNKEFIGDNINIQFYCNGNGNIEYTSMNFNTWIYTKMRYKADTTSI